MDPIELEWSDAGEVALGGRMINGYDHNPSCAFGTNRPIGWQPKPSPLSQAETDLVLGKYSGNKIIHSRQSIHRHSKSRESDHQLVTKMTNISELWMTNWTS
jgi:hypothetical protein